MDETLGYPPAATRWNIEGENHDYAATAFHSMLAARGFGVLMNHDLRGKREGLRPDSIAGRSILWSEHDSRRTHLLSWSGGDAITLIHQDEEGGIDVSVASNDLELARKIIAEIDKLLPREAESGDRVLPMAFWHRGDASPELTERRIEVVRWTDIAANYAGLTKTRLAALIEHFKPAKNGGRLLLWHGEPGTGKTFAIRALASAWREWCRFEYVIDPEQLFGSGSYLTDVVLDRFEGHYLFEDNPSKEKWRLLIIEDSGELMAMDAKNEVGQGLSRLLNLSDGILGQGTKILILVTTNDELGRLNPAVRRHGRCLSEIEFRRFHSDEAAEWLRRAGCNFSPGGPQTLSELYAIRGGQNPIEGMRKIGFRAADLPLARSAIDAGTGFSAKGGAGGLR